MDLSGWDLSVMHLDSNFLSFSMWVVCRVDHIVAIFFMPMKFGFGHTESIYFAL